VRQRYHGLGCLPANAALTGLAAVRESQRWRKTKGVSFSTTKGNFPRAPTKNKGNDTHHCTHPIRRVGWSPP